MTRVHGVKWIVFVSMNAGSRFAFEIFAVDFAEVRCSRFAGVVKLLGKTIIGLHNAMRPFLQASSAYATELISSQAWYLNECLVAIRALYGTYA